LLPAGGWVAVDIFFVLSGFLVSGLLFKESSQHGTVSLSRFLIRRGFKIYPAFWTMLAATVALTLWRGGSISLGNLSGELFYFQNYGFALCLHTWSLAVEEHFYFLLAGLFFILRWRAGPGQPINFNAIPNLFLTVAVLCLTFRFITWAVILSATNENQHWFIYADHALLDSLFFGVLLSYLWHHHWNEQMRQKIISFRWLFALAGLGLLLPGVVPMMDMQWFRIFGFILIYLGAGCLLLSCLALDYFPCPIFIKWLASMGKYSYSVYLWHWIVGDCLFPLFDLRSNTRLSLIVNALTYFALSWLFGIFMAKIIEFPILRLRDRWFPSLSQS
jgi:peptidoglycan/LPS O-acetylase OafA/YrhL